jgi:GLPGLI family protein
MKRLLLLLIVFYPLTAAAQEGKIVYTYSVKYDFADTDNPRLKEMAPTESAQQMVLHFNEYESSMTENVEKRTSKGGTDRGKASISRFKMISASRSDQETLLATYVDYEEGTVVDSRDFMGKVFRIRGEIQTYAWKLDGEQSEFLGYPVQKATALQDTVSIVAWFAPSIPTEAGPGLYGGLPGAVLMLSVDDGRKAYTATEISLDALDGVQIIRPEKGDEVTREEYEIVVEEKLVELKAMMSRRGSDRR